MMGNGIEWYGVESFGAMRHCPDEQLLYEKEK